MIVEANNVYRYYSGEKVLDNISIKIENNDRIGLIGINGSGKTTLLDIISGVYPPDEGSVSCTGTIGYLKQNPGLYSSNSIYEEMRTVFAPLLETEKKLEEIYKRIASEKDGDKLRSLNREYSRLQTDFEHKDGYNINVKINSVLNGMGFLSRDFDTKISVLSGGEKTRISLAKLLLSEPELLILDEPTNHLDFKALNWLENYLASYKGAILMVSHDRYFLDRTVNEIAEIYNGRLKRYKGNYSKFAELKREQTEFLKKEYQKQQHKIASMTEYVERNRARASTAKSARSRENALEKMEIIEDPREYEKHITIDFEYDIEPVTELLFASISALYAGEERLCGNLELELRRGQKIAIVGGNGKGKTTFLKALLGKAVYDGKIKWGRNVKISYFEQESHDFKPNNSVLSEISRKCPSKNDFEIRSALGKYNITGDDAFKTIGVLSGGELAKVKFCIMTLNRGNVLILDEPTNHLDLSAKEVLDEALTSFDGTVIAVSHDRYLLNKFPDAIYELGDSGLIKYIGKYDDYVANKFEEKPVLSRKDPSAAGSYHRSKKDRADKVKAANELKKTEKAIAEKEKELSILETEISSPEISSDYVLLREKCVMIDELKEQIAKLYEKWEMIV